MCISYANSSGQHIKGTIEKMVGRNSPLPKVALRLVLAEEAAWEQSQTSSGSVYIACLVS